MKRTLLILPLLGLSMFLSAQITVGCVPNGYFQDVYLWAWTDEGDLFDAWPGIQLSQNEEGAYTYTFDESITNVNLIFNDGGSNGSGSVYQTYDITNVTTSTTYIIAGSNPTYPIFHYADIVYQLYLGTSRGGSLYMTNDYSGTTEFIEPQASGFSWVRPNSHITLTTEPVDGYQFTCWNNGSTEPDIDFTMPEYPLSYIAFFAPENQRNITVHVYPNNEMPEVWLYAYNDYQQLATAEDMGIQLRNPDRNGVLKYTFPDSVKYFDFMLHDNYTKGILSSDNSPLLTRTYYYINITEDVCINLTGIQAPYRNLMGADANYCTWYNLIVTAAEGGTVNNVSGEYEEGTTLQLIATADENYTFEGWSDGNTDNPREIVINQDISLQALFKSTKVTYTITATAAEGGMVNEVSGTYPEGTELLLIATPQTGYKFYQWSDGLLDNPRQIIVNQDLALEALFTASSGEKFPVYIISTHGGSLQQTFDGVYEDGTLLHLVAIPDENYVFYEWSGSDLWGWLDSQKAERYLTIERKTELFAMFLPTYSLLVEAGSGGSLQRDMSGRYPTNQCIEVEAIPDEGYRFLRWDDDIRDNPRTIILHSNLQIKALFTVISSTEDINSSYRIYSQNKHIIISLPSADDIHIYSATGQLIYAAHTSNADITAQAGLYLVSTNRKTYKVIVK